MQVQNVQHVLCLHQMCAALNQHPTQTLGAGAGGTVKGCLGGEGSKHGGSAGQSKGEDVQVAVSEDTWKLAGLMHAVHHFPATNRLMLMGANKNYDTMS